MGDSKYSVEDRAISGRTAYFSKASMSDAFTQIKEKKAHETMIPYNMTVREARDSENHPNTIPVIIALDLTGSMGPIPKMFIGEGLPTMMSTIIQKGVPDAAVLFLGVGDHECDRYPLQVGQFESGDQELDMWLTRVYPEEGGGANPGESYLLAWYVAANYTVTDAWEKRGKKGVLFTIGDEPSLETIPASEIKRLFGVQQAQPVRIMNLLESVREKWEVYHFNLSQTQSGSRNSVKEYWKRLLGQNAIIVDDYNDLPRLIAEIVLKHSMEESSSAPTGIYSSSPKDNPASPAGEEVL